MPQHRFQTVEQYLSAQPQPVCDIGLAAANVVEAGLPGAEASLWHGHPTWRFGKEPVVQVKAFTRHVTLGFPHGAAFADPSGRLVAGAKGEASVKLRSLDDIDPDLFEDWLRQATEARTLER